MEGQYVLVTTEYRGVFFGKLEDSSPNRAVKLSKARNVVHWSKVSHGVFGLAKSGPQDGSRIGPQVDSIKLYGVTSITPCTDVAIKQFEKELWS